MTDALRLSGVTKNFGQTEIIRGVDLSVAHGERHAIIGPNGAGKSTLFHLITGRYAPTSGKIEVNGNDVTGLPAHKISRMGVSRSFQVTNIFPLMSVFENIRCGLLWSMGYKYSFIRQLSRDQQLNQRTDEVLAEIGLLDQRDLEGGVLAYADQRALELGIAIASGAEILLLDEPVAGMSHTEVNRAVELVRRISEGKTLVVVEHDMGVVFDVADRISVLVYGEIIASDSPENIRANAAVQEAYLGGEAL